MSFKKIPDRWEKYSNIGSVIPGTSFLAFKVPLKPQLSKNLPENAEEFKPSDLVEHLYSNDLKVGLIIDLTNTKRYYDSQDFETEGIYYVKIFTEGHIVPSQRVCQQFFDTVDEFLASESEYNLIGVHCTHGVNRTGYLICRYMIDKLNMEPMSSIEAFAAARGHPIERENYIQALTCVKKERENPSLYASRNDYTSGDWAYGQGRNHDAYNNFSQTARNNRNFNFSDDVYDAPNSFHHTSNTGNSRGNSRGNYNREKWDFPQRSGGYAEAGKWTNSRSDVSNWRTANRGSNSFETYNGGISNNGADLGGDRLNYNGEMSNKGDDYNGWVNGKINRNLNWNRGKGTEQANPIDNNLESSSRDNYNGGVNKEVTATNEHNNSSKNSSAKRIKNNNVEVSYKDVKTVAKQQPLSLPNVAAKNKSHLLKTKISDFKKVKKEDVLNVGSSKAKKH